MSRILEFPMVLLILITAQQVDVSNIHRICNIFFSKISSYIRITKTIKVAPIQQTCFFADFEFGG